MKVSVQFFQSIQTYGHEQEIFKHLSVSIIFSPDFNRGVPKSFWELWTIPVLNFLKLKSKFCSYIPLLASQWFIYGQFLLRYCSALRRLCRARYLKKRVPAVQLVSSCPYRVQLKSMRGAPENISEHWPDHDKQIANRKAKILILLINISGHVTGDWSFMVWRES